jgi:hypothetical protein
LEVGGAMVIATEFDELRRARHGFVQVVGYYRGAGRFVLGMT